MRLERKVRIPRILAWGQGYWANVPLLMYPFFVLAALAYGDSLKFGLLLRLLIAAAFNAIFFITLLHGIQTLPIPLRKAVLRLVYLSQFLYLFLSGYHFSLYGQLIGLPSIFPVIDSNSDEVQEFLISYFRWDYLAAALFLALPMLHFFLYSPSISTSTPGFRPWACGIAWSVFAATTAAAVFSHKPYLTDYNVFAHLGTNLSVAIREKLKIRQLAAQVAEVKGVRVTRSIGKEIHVLIINESVTRNHMSLYGYPRNTTPGLSSMSEQLFVLRDACSSHDNTLEALKHMLTFTTDVGQELVNTPNLIQLMKAAGFTTYWLSNQQSVSLGDSYISFIAKSADHKIFVNHRRLNEGVSLDEKLLGPLAEVLKSDAEKKFIVIHMIGAHAGYDLRYPRSYAFFDGEKVDPMVSGKTLSSVFSMKKYNEYDNAILYNDYVSIRVMKELDLDMPVTAFYLSDHGEAIDEHDGFFGHGMNLPYRSMYEIPAFFWFSQEARKAFGGKIKNLQRNLAEPFQGDQTIHTLLDLYGIRYPLVKLQNSLVQENFTPHARRCDQPRYRSSTRPGRQILISRDGKDIDYRILDVKTKTVSTPP